MLSALVKLAAVALATVTLAAAVVAYRGRTEQAREVARLAVENAALRDVADRLGTDRRVADVLVTAQRPVGGVLTTDLLFVEYGRDDRPMPGRRFTVAGDVVHVGALVIKFDRSFVRSGDGLRGRSVALFTRLYGDGQAPADAFPIDAPGEAPAAYAGDDVDRDAAAFEASLWRDFWRLAGDEGFAASRGVRVAHGQSVWGMFKPGRLYTLTLENDGGLGLEQHPIRGIYREAMGEAAGKVAGGAE